MEFVLGSLQQSLGIVLPFLFVLTSVIFVHELGHFLVARWCGVRVVVFSIGFGPTLLSWKDRRGTCWRIALIPLGGYVQFYGDTDPSSLTSVSTLSSFSSAEQREMFIHKNLWQRSAVVAAGPMANFILSFLLLAFVLFFQGRFYLAPVIGEVRPRSPAAEAGLIAGDVILSIDTHPIENFGEVQRLILFGKGRPLTLQIARGEEVYAMEATPRIEMITDRFGNRYEAAILGIVGSSAPEHRRFKRYSLPQAFVEGLQEFWLITAQTGIHLFGLFTGSESLSQLGGPIMIAEVSGQMASLGISPLLNLLAVLSLSIGLLNLLPIPLLDGGHLVFYLCEAVRGRPLDSQTQSFLLRLGLAVILGLMLLALWNDLWRLVS